VQRGGLARRALYTTVSGEDIMNARQMADIMMRWPDGMAADDRKFFTALARRFPHEDPDEMHKAVRIVAFEKAEKVRQMEQDLGLSGQPPTDG